MYVYIYLCTYLKEIMGIHIYILISQSGNRSIYLSMEVNNGNEAVSMKKSRKTK